MAGPAAGYVSAGIGHPGVQFRPRSRCGPVGQAGLKPPDASHVATAAISNANEMHTFDKKLLDLDGLVTKADGTKMKICKPDVGDLPPLLQVTTREHIEEPSDDEPSDEGDADPESEKDSDTGVRGANPALLTRSGLVKGTPNLAYKLMLAIRIAPIHRRGGLRRVARRRA